MHKAVTLINTLVGEEEERVIRQIETEYGREVLTASYTNHALAAADAEG